MSATEEQMELLSAAGVTHVSYVLIIYSFAFILYLFVNILLHIYAVHAWPTERKQKDDEAQRPNGHVRTESRVREAEEFELAGLMSDDEDEETKPLTGANGHANGHA